MTRIARQVVRPVDADAQHRDRRQALLLEVGEQRVLVPGQALVDLLERVDGAVGRDEADDVPRDAPLRDLEQVLVVPLLEGLVPREDQQPGGLVGGRAEEEPHRCTPGVGLSLDNSVTRGTPPRRRSCSRGVARPSGVLQNAGTTRDSRGARLGAGRKRICRASPVGAARQIGVSTRRAPEGIRTPNLLIRSQMLYPLSYGCVVFSCRARRLRDLNPGWGLTQTALAVRRHRPD